MTITMTKTNGKFEIDLHGTVFAISENMKSNIMELQVEWKEGQLEDAFQLMDEEDDNWNYGLTTTDEVQLEEIEKAIREWMFPDIGKEPTFDILTDKEFYNIPKEKRTSQNITRSGEADLMDTMGMEDMFKQDVEDNQITFEHWLKLQETEYIKINRTATGNLWVR